MAFVHAEGAFCGHNLPQKSICPRRRGFLWTQPSPEWHSSTQKGAGVDAKCPEWHLSTQRGLFVDTTYPKMAFVHAEGGWRGCKVPRMAFVHAERAFCGHNIPQNGIRPRRGGFLWTLPSPKWHLSTQKGPGVDAMCYREDWGGR